MSDGHVPHRADPFICLAIEVVVLALVTLSPWAIGAVKPVFEWMIMCGVAALLLLWALRTLLRGEMTWRHCPLGLFLAGIVLFTAFQLLPLPRVLLEVVSPQLVRLHQDLLPVIPEVNLADGQPLAAPAETFHSLSVFPHRTRGLLLQLLTAFSVYAVVRNTISGSDSRRRIAWACVINGALLSLFALAHSQSASPHMLFWSIPVEGSVFGPFVNRNDFPFYIDLCIGLGFGLLRADKNRPKHYGHAEMQKWELWLDSFFTALQSPKMLATVLSLVLMFVASVYSLSRGGLIAQLLAGAICVVIWLRSRFQSSWRPATIGGAAMVTVLLIAWLGVQPLEERLATLDDAPAAGEERFQIWRPLARAAVDFPLFGTGGGTCEFVEPLYRPAFQRGMDLNIEFAHNDYLEAAVEGGLIRLSLTLALVGVVLFRGWRYFGSRWGSRHDEGLGLFWALLAIMAHSIVDFGLHIPAVAVLTAVVAGFFMHITDPHSEPVRPVHRPLQSIASATFLLMIGLILVFEGWKGDRVERLRVAARNRAQAGVIEPQQFVFLDAAVRLVPDDAVLHQTLGQAHLNAIQAGDSTSDHLPSALRHLTTARNLCPLIAHPHARLAELRNNFRSPDPAIIYWERAVRVLPSDPELWFACGAQHLVDGRVDDAWVWWRHYLTVTDARLPEILARARDRSGSDGVRPDRFPEMPALLVKVANVLYPKPEAMDERRPFLERAVAILATSSDGPSLRLRGQIQISLGLTEAATASYALALKQDPLQSDWRLEYARLLRSSGRLSESLKELTTILRSKPELREAQDLRDVVERELMLKGKLGTP